MTFKEWWKENKKQFGSFASVAHRIVGRLSWEARGKIADARETELRAEIERLKGERDALREQLNTKEKTMIKADAIATRVDGFDECKNPGDFYITEPNEHEGGARRLSFLCPCGCGVLCGCKIRDDGQNIGGAWGWNGSKNKPTLTPSIRISGKTPSEEHWHGYLTDGVFKSC